MRRDENGTGVRRSREDERGGFKGGGKDRKERHTTEASSGRLTVSFPCDGRASGPELIERSVLPRLRARAPIAQRILPAGKTPAILDKMQNAGRALRRMLLTNSPLNFVRKIIDVALQMLQQSPPFAMLQ